jgi:hypothetical protein
MMRLDKKVEKSARLGLRCILLLVSVLLVAGCMAEEEPVDYVEILSRIHEGDEREQALQALSDAWYHSECRFLDGAVEDLFLYGPKERDSVTIIGILSEPHGERLIVKQAGTYEGYFLDAPDFGRFCEPPVQNAFESGRARETKNS